MFFSQRKSPHQKESQKGFSLNKFVSNFLSIFFFDPRKRKQNTLYKNLYKNKFQLNFGEEQTKDQKI